ncbi:MAG: hypothetical protein GX661_06185 [Acholeplasmataceae bacterium]|nr:hypothetical protein [Acholeplasmataceae bacterium]
MTRFTRKLLFSIFSFTFFFSILGTVTYAWFSLSQLNRLNNLDINIVTGDEFQISLDGINFSKEISTEDIERVIGTQALLADVTSFDGETFVFGILNKDKTPVANVDYLSFTLYFRTTRPQKYVYLVDNVSDQVQYDQVRDGTYVVSQGIDWRADCTFLNGPNPETDMVYPGERKTFYASDAVRISFIEEKIVENPLDQRSGSELSKKIFDLSGAPERGYGILFGELSYFNEKHNTDLLPPSTIPNTIYHLTHFEEYNPRIAVNRNSEILEMIETDKKDEENNTYYLGKVQVYVWIEGWDADCFNAIYNDSLRIRLKFQAGNPVISNI